jgi:hypothetical protein
MRVCPHASIADTACAAGRPIHATSGALRQRVERRVRGQVADRAVAGVHGIHAAPIAVPPEEVERARAGTRQVARHADQRDGPRCEQPPEACGLALAGARSSRQP